MSDTRHPGLNLGIRHPAAHEEAEALVFGFWVFLMSDLVLFACLFATYATMLDATAGAPDGKTLYDIKIAAMETASLLLSSFTFGLASIALKHGEHDPKVATAAKRWLTLWLAVTLVLGLVFLGLELRDFQSMAEKGGIPSRSGFISATWVLIATHGLHVTMGSLWILVTIVQLFVLGLTDQMKTRVLRLGLFWHFLDIVWIGIFSVVYLRGLA